MAVLALVPPEAAHSLALAVVASSNEPLLLLDGDLNLVAASVSFCRAFQVDAASVPGRAMFALGEGEWDVPRLHSLLDATLAGYAEIEAYEMELRQPGRPTRCLVLHAHKLDYAGDVRLILAMSDVTEARADARLKDDLIRQKAILLKELQHRVANSLQIIASVLMQSARRVQSDEARGHLREAHQRVMSVAAVQQQLATSQLGDVAMRPYLMQLCESLAASMIHDPSQLTLVATIDDSACSGDESISLGLIMTELVINALKHAFPDHRHGAIDVRYQADGEAWTLSVKDDGIGMPTGPIAAKPGLGTSIVEALAKQLQARVDVRSGGPGTTVSIIHERAPVAVNANARTAAV